MKKLYELAKTVGDMNKGKYIADLGLIEKLADEAIVEFQQLECGYECHYAAPYGFVPEAGCPIHD